MANLNGIWIKIQRAGKHIEELRSLVQDYLESEPFTLYKTEKENGDLIYRVRIEEEIPLEWSAIIGDTVHNLRSALDHLAWQLVEVSGGTPSRNTMFPIGDSKGYNKYLTQKLDGANAVAQRFVRRLRPHSGGNTTLTQLHALDITDKHKLVLVVGAAHKNFTIKPNMDIPWQDEPVEFPPIAITPADRQFPLRDGAEVFGISASARTEKDTSQYGITFELAFGDVTEVQGLPLLETLEDMHRHVEKIVQIADRQFFT